MVYRNEAGYLAALAFLMTNGVNKGDRTGTGTRSKFGAINLEFDLEVNDYPLVPLLSTKEVLHEKLRVELDWMVSGSSRLEPLISRNVHIWDNWVLKGTEVYGGLLLTYEQRAKWMTKAQQAEFKAYQEREDLYPMIVAGKLTTPEKRSAVIAHINEYFDGLGLPKYNLIGGDLGPVYGRQWRDWADTRYITVINYMANREDYERRGFKVIDKNFACTHVVIERRIDQLARLEEQLRTDRDSRRMILTAWNVAHIDEMALPPCHTMAQFAVEPDPRDGADVLSCKLFQRSGDMFLGIPFNFAFYSILTHQLAAINDMRPGKLYHTIGDAHIYSNHFDQVREQLSRQPLADNRPEIILPSTNKLGKRITSVAEYGADDYRIEGYEHMSFIRAPVAV